MNYLKQAVSRTALSVAEYVTPVLRTSKFQETGVITPDEFVTAGDFLVHHCPTWQWASGDKPPKPYLPPDKQYLFTRNVPCYKRINQLTSQNDELDFVVDDEDDAGGWVTTRDVAFTAEDTFQPMDMHNKTSDTASTSKVTDKLDSLNLENEDEAEDMEAFMQSGMLDAVDPAVVTRVSDNQPSTSSNTTNDEYADQVLRTRTYDLFITYDKYYQTPRMWLRGYDENRKFLTEEEMFQDFSQDHAHKTLTMEQHPHLTSAHMPSVHPCRQAEVMSKLISAMAVKGSQLHVYQYFIVFLKFIQAIIPTIEYDYTRTFSMG